MRSALTGNVHSFANVSSIDSQFVQIMVHHERLKRRDEFCIQAESGSVPPYLLLICGVTLSWRKG